MSLEPWATGWKSRTALLLICGGLAMVFSRAADAATNGFSVVNSGTSAYVINGTSNPNLALVRGFTYAFQLNASGHPFWIKTIQGNGTGNAYTNGVSGNGTQIGTLTFSVPTNAPALLFYNCQFHTAMTGQLAIEDPPEVRLLEVALAADRLLLKSSGTAALNVYVRTSSNLLENTWLSEPVLTNSFSGGTNSTEIGLPPQPVRFIQLLQGLP